MKKILLVSNHDAQSTGYGAGQRTNQIWKALLSIGHTDVAWLVNADRDGVERYEVDGAQITKIETKACRPSDYWWNGLYSGRIARAFEAGFNLADYDVVVSRYITPAAKLDLGRSKKLLVDFDDPVYHFPWSAFANPRNLTKEFLRLLNQRLIDRKLRARPLRDAQFMFVNSRDRTRFPALKGALLPNIPCIPSDAKIRSKPTADGQRILFVGLMTYQPNIEAVDHFLGEIWPAILRQCPQASFHIVGKTNEENRKRWQAHRGCVVEGFVKDISAAYASASVAVSPIRSGGGSNIKIPEACIYGCPVVTTEYSFSGWVDYFERDTDLMVAASSNDFSDKCIQLLTNPDMAQTLARSSKQRTDTDLSLAATTSRLRAMVAPSFG